MNKIDTAIFDIDKVICGNISKFDDSERGLLSQNILSQLRNFVEHIALKAYAGKNDIESTYDKIVAANAFIRSRGNLRFLCRFHDFLQITASHYTLDPGNSERLMLKYYEYLLRIKSLLKNTYGLDVLKNIDDFPIVLDPALKEYYEKIVEAINQRKSTRVKSSYTDRYYIQKIKPFFVRHEVFYEVTFTTANERASKFDRIIAFTKADISPNYAVKLAVSNDDIDVLGKKMPIQIIDDWEVSIRPCELDNFASIFGKHPKIEGGTAEYRALMEVLTERGQTLVELMDAPDAVYDSIKAHITSGARTTYIVQVLDKSRALIRSRAPGINTIRYLLYRLNNKIIKRQYNSEECNLLSNLKLRLSCNPFERMPFATSLVDHNPKLHDLFDCLDSTDREHELLAKRINNNIEVEGKLYTPLKEITGFKNIDDLVQRFNARIYKTHGHRKIQKYKDHLYVQGYEEDTHKIIERLRVLSSESIKGYSKSVDSWLQKSSYSIDCEEKRAALRELFEKSAVALIYGSAGTGKSTLINGNPPIFNRSQK